MTAKSFLFSILSLMLSLNTFAQKEQRVAVFKNGTGFFFTPMTIKPENGKFLVKNPPAALFGTLWFYTEDKPIKSLKSYESEEKTTQTKKASNFYELLYANVGKEITLTLSNGNEVTGKIQSTEPSMILLQTTKPSTGFMALDISEIKSFTFATAPKTDYAPLVEQRVIEIEFDKASSQENIEIAYLQRGIGWLPSYLVHLKDDQKAQIVLRAELINDAQDLENATLSMVVGVPNFKYNNLISPFVSNASLEQFLNQLNGSYGDFRRNRDMMLSNAITTQSMAYESIDIVGGGGGPEELETSSQEDLFFYTKKRVTLPKGGRALYALFTEEVNYKHLYEVILPKNDGYTITYRNDSEQKNDVYHSIELKNTTNYPWTTGTAMVTQSQNGLPEVLSQDMIKYTAQSSKTMLRLTVAPDILVKDNEIESDRKVNVKEKGIVYDIVTVKGTIEIKNLKDKTINLKIMRQITGEMLSSDAKWNVEKRPNYYRAINQTNDVSWELNLNAGKSQTISYSYQFYVKK